MDVPQKGIVLSEKAAYTSDLAKADLKVCFPSQYDVCWHICLAALRFMHAACPPASISLRP